MPSEVLYKVGDPWYDVTTDTQEVQTPMIPITDKQLAYLASLIDDMQKLAADAKDKLGLDSAVTHALSIDEAFRTHLTEKTLSKSNASTAIEHCIVTNQRLRDALKDVKASTPVPEANPESPAVPPVPAAADFKDKKAAITEDGMYRNHETDEIFKVQKSPNSGRLYAKKLVIAEEAVWDTAGPAGEEILVTPAKIRFDYARGAVYKLNPTWKMSLDEAKAFGALYGTCCKCGRTLTKEESIEAGIGPICAGYFS